MSAAAIKHQPVRFGSGRNVDPNEETVWVENVEIFWGVRSSYCGTLPPQHLDLNELINWLYQKTRKEPVDPELGRWENVRRVLERTAMTQLRGKLMMARMRKLRPH